MVRMPLFGDAAIGMFDLAKAGVPVDSRDDIVVLEHATISGQPNGRASACAQFRPNARGTETAFGSPGGFGRSVHHTLLIAILRGVAFSTFGRLSRNTPWFNWASILLWSITSESVNCR